MYRPHRDFKDNDAEVKIKPIRIFLPKPVPIVTRSRTEAVVQKKALFTLNRRWSFYKRDLDPKSSTTAINVCLTMLSNRHTEPCYERKSARCIHICDL